jgi:phage terminase large subunit-like protein
LSACCAPGSSAGPAEGLARVVADSLAGLTAAEIAILLGDWPLWARDDQLPPADADPARPWRTWLLLGGRGAGKTRAGAEWIKAQAVASGQARIALVGETMSDVRTVMVEGASGLLAIHDDGERPLFEPSKRQLTWPNGAVAHVFSAEEPASLRGPQFTAAWCDELCKWRYARETWDMLQFALRIGDGPRQVVTTTPRPLALLKEIMADAATRVSRMRTADNAGNLAASFVDEVNRRYAGTPLGRQELDGEIVEDRTDALWRREWFENNRIAEAPALSRIVVAVDPGVTSGIKADASGIVAAGMGPDRRGYVIADQTVRGHEPLTWARTAVALYERLAADCIVAEVNQGGELIELALRQVDPDVPVRRVYATRGKWLRAEPVAALYADGRVSHVGRLADLEDEMCDFGPNGLSGGRSPDRLDALVWALTELMLPRRAQPAVRSL